MSPRKRPDDEPAGEDPPAEPSEAEKLTDSLLAPDVDDDERAEALARLQHQSEIPPDSDEPEPLCATCNRAGGLEECADCELLYCTDHVEDHDCQGAPIPTPTGDAADDFLSERRNYATRRDAQSSMLDIVLDDKELGDYLETELETEEAAKRNRDAKKGRKEKLINAHRSVINSGDDGEHSGYVIVTSSTGKQYRFKPEGGYHDEQETVSRSKAGFKLDSDIALERVGAML